MEAWGIQPLSANLLRARRSMFGQLDKSSLHLQTWAFECTLHNWWCPGQKQLKFVTLVVLSGVDSSYSCLLASIEVFLILQLLIDFGTLMLKFEIFGTGFCREWPIHLNILIGSEKLRCEMRREEGSVLTLGYTTFQGSVENRNFMSFFCLSSEQGSSYCKLKHCFRKQTNL